VACARPFPARLGGSGGQSASASAKAGAKHRSPQIDREESTRGSTAYVMEGLALNLRDLSLLSRQSTSRRPHRRWRGWRRLMPPVARSMRSSGKTPRECRSSGTPPGGMDRSPMLPVGGYAWPVGSVSTSRPARRVGRSGRTGSNLVVSISDYYLRRVVERLGQTVRVNESTALIAQLLSRASQPETQAVPSVSADMDGGTSTAPDSIEATQPRTIARL
jgi:hypothetical protein